LTATSATTKPLDPVAWVLPLHHYLRGTKPPPLIGPEQIISPIRNPKSLKFQNYFLYISAYYKPQNWILDLFRTLPFQFNLS
jgi:hypothetical protein